MITRAQMPRQLRDRGGIMTIKTVRQKYGLGDFVRKIIPNELARVAEIAAPIVAIANPGLASFAAVAGGLGRYDRTGDLGSSALYGAGVQLAGAASPGFESLGTKGATTFGSDVTKNILLGKEGGTGLLKDKGLFGAAGEFGLKEAIGGGTPGVFLGTTALSLLGQKLVGPKREDESEEEYLQRRKTAVGNYLRRYYSNLNPTASATDVEAFVQRNTVDYKAEGGRIGYQTGGVSKYVPPFVPSDVLDLFKRYEDIQTPVLASPDNPDFIGETALGNIKKGLENFANTYRFQDLSGGFDEVKADIEDIYKFIPAIRTAFSPDLTANYSGGDIYDYLTDFYDYKYGAPGVADFGYFDQYGEGGQFGPDRPRKKIFESKFDKPYRYGLSQPTSTVEQTPAPTPTPTPTGIQTIPSDKKVFNVMLDEKGNVADDQSLTELFRETGTAPRIGIGGPVPIRSVSDAFRLAGITGEDGISMGTDYGDSRTLPSGGIANTLPAITQERSLRENIAINEARRRRNQELLAAAKARLPKMKKGGMMDVPVRTNPEGIRELDYRKTGGFVPIGVKEKADDVPAMLSLNEFVMTADAVRGAGDGNIEKGAQRMYDTMKKLESRVE